MADFEPHRIHPDRRRDHRPCLAHRGAGLKKARSLFERERAFYSLDAIISVGYRVNSRRATLFRQWATKVLNEFIRKGFVLDDDRLNLVDSFY